jgi:hypothetical protein
VAKPFNSHYPPQLLLHVPSSMTEEGVRMPSQSGSASVAFMPYLGPSSSDLMAVLATAAEASACNPCTPMTFPYLTTAAFPRYGEESARGACASYVIAHACSIVNATDRTRSFISTTLQVASPSALPQSISNDWLEPHQPIMELAPLAIPRRVIHSPHQGMNFLSGEQPSSALPMSAGK